MIHSFSRRCLFGMKDFEFVAVILSNLVLSLIIGEGP